MLQHHVKSVFTTLYNIFVINLKIRKFLTLYPQVQDLGSTCIDMSVGAGASVCEMRNTTIFEKIGHECSGDMFIN